MSVRYQLVSTTIRLGDGKERDLIDLDHLAIDLAQRREQAEGKDVFNKVCRLGFWWIERLRDKGDEG